MRAEAEDERATMVEGRVRAGEDPWEFMQELPGVDELVVLLLRDEIIEDDGGVRRTPGQDEELLRAIVTAYPALGPTVDALAAGLGRTGARWLNRGVA
nr:tryptophan synthase subunit alpha [Pseudoclavibacter chungangensis]